MTKLEALQLALRSYFERFPRVSIKALSMRSDVPYATLRRIMQSDVNHIKDETIFKLLDRVISRKEQLTFIRNHYPSLDRMIEVVRNADITLDESLALHKKFCRMNPHNLILKLALTQVGTTRETVERLTGEFGLMALDEMIVSGFLVEDRRCIRANKNAGEMGDREEMREQIALDAQYLSRDLKAEHGFITHTFEAVTPEALARIVALGKKLQEEVDGIKGTEAGTVPFFFDVVIGTYDPSSLEAED